MARSEEKAKAWKDKGVQVRIGDFDDPASLEKAFARIDKLLLISTVAQNRGEQQRAVVEAVSYTHLDVYKRQRLHDSTSIESRFGLQAVIHALAAGWQVLQRGHHCRDAQTGADRLGGASLGKRLRQPTQPAYKRKFGYFLVKFDSSLR